MSDPAEIGTVLDGHALAALLSKRSGLSKKSVRSVLKELGAATGIALKQGQLVRIPGLGTLKVRINPKDSPDKLPDTPRKIILVAAKKLKSEAFCE